MTVYSRIIGWGKYVPQRVLTNADLEKMVETSDAWIRSRTGIQERRIVDDPDESTATLATRAARRALAKANVDPDNLDLIIVASSTPDYSFPATACLVQDALGASHAGAYDLSAACSGFVYGLAMAHGQIVAGLAKTILVIGAETLSRITDWSDRNTCVLFGDGAGAVVVQASDQPGGLLSAVLGSDGSGADLLIVPASGTRYPTTMKTVANGDHYIKMAGREVFRFAVRVMANATREVVQKAGLTLEDVDWIIPHQANVRIIQASVVRQLKFPADRVYMNLDRYGNTSTASIPIALVEAIEEGKLKAGDHIVFVGFGGGLTWAAALLQWGVKTPKPPLPWQKRIGLTMHYQLALLRSFLRRWRRKVIGFLFGSPDTETTTEKVSAHVDKLGDKVGDHVAKVSSKVYKKVESDKTTDTEQERKSQH